jgi:hypothetical protein
MYGNAMAHQNQHHQSQTPPAHQQQSQQHPASPYDAASGGYDYGSSHNPDNTPVDLMNLNHMVGDVDPTLGGMTFSPGATYTESLQYPGPLSLSYYYGSNYGMSPDGSHEGANHTPQPQHQQPQSSSRPQQQRQQNGSSHQGHSPDLGSPSDGTVHGPSSNSSSGVLFGPPNGPNAVDMNNLWDPTFLTFSSYQFNGYGLSSSATGLHDNPSMQSNNGNDNNNGLASVNDTLGLHPPMMLPYWSSEAGISAKTEPDHEMAFGRH